MLVLSRKAGQSILVDGEIRIVITKIQGNCVRIGIEAPQAIPIRRGELEPASSDDAGVRCRELYPV